MTHGVEGLLTLPKEPDALTLSLVHVLANEKMRREMGQRGRQSSQQYGWDRIARRVLSYYERLLYEHGLLHAPRVEVQPELHPGD